jgi:hypothetical protein
LRGEVGWRRLNVNGMPNKKNCSYSGINEILLYVAVISLMS